MRPSNITWEAGGSTDMAMLSFLPQELRDVIEPTGGFILHHGAIHFRGCTTDPEWNSLLSIYHGEHSLKTLYPAVDVDDIPFAQDQFGDQFLLRGTQVMQLEAETGEIRLFARYLTEFTDGISADIEDYLNVSLSHRLEPGQGLHASPPFCIKESASVSSLRPVPIAELIEFHADLALQIADIPDGGMLRFQVVD